MKLLVTMIPKKGSNVLSLDKYFLNKVSLQSIPLTLKRKLIYKLYTDNACYSISLHSSLDLYPDSLFFIHSAMANSTLKSRPDREIEPDS